MPYRFTLPRYDSIDLENAHSSAQAVSMGVYALFGSHDTIRFHDFYNSEKTRWYSKHESKILIRAILNDGPEKFTEELIEVPNLFNLSEEEAWDHLKDLGLDLGKVTKLSLFSDVVVKQDPKADSLVPRDTKVDIWLNLKTGHLIIQNLRKLATQLSKYSYTSRAASSQLLGGRVRLLG